MTHAWQPFNWYRDVAYYDLIFDQTTQEEVAFLEGIVERHGHGAPSGRAALHQDGAQRQLGARPGRAGRALPRVLEPGCGSGRLVAALAERGWSVTGFDIEPRALGFAKARVKGTARRRIALSLGRFDAFQAPRAHFDLAPPCYLGAPRLCLPSLIGCDATVTIQIAKKIGMNEMNMNDYDMSVR